MLNWDWFDVWKLRATHSVALIHLAARAMSSSRPGHKWSELSTSKGRLIDIRWYVNVLSGVGVCLAASRNTNEAGSRKRCRRFNQVTKERLFSSGVFRFFVRFTFFYYVCIFSCLYYLPLVTGFVKKRWENWHIDRLFYFVPVVFCFYWFAGQNGAGGCEEGKRDKNVELLLWFRLSGVNEYVTYCRIVLASTFSIWLSSFLLLTLSLLSFHARGDCRPNKRFNNSPWNKITQTLSITSINNTHTPAIRDSYGTAAFFYRPDCHCRTSFIFIPFSKFYTSRKWIVTALRLGGGPAPISR